VGGVGAVVLAVPPVAVVYHFNEVPVAVKGKADEFKQYTTGVVTTGAGVGALTFITTASLAEQVELALETVTV
jgi:hypothetical protein